MPNTGPGVLFLSQEMRAIDLANRAAANLGRMDMEALTTGRFKGDDWSRIAEAIEKGARLRLHIDDQPGLSLALINAKARQHQQRHGLGYWSWTTFSCVQALTAATTGTHRSKKSRAA